MAAALFVLLALLLVRWTVDLGTWPGACVLLDVATIAGPLALAFLL